MRARFSAAAIGLLVAVAAALPAGARTGSAQEAPPPADARAAAEALNQVGSTPALGVGAAGAPVVRAQILLDRAWFGPGEIDGRFSTTMGRAVRAFQSAHGLPVSGRIDAATWSALDADTAPLFAVHTLTDADTAGPFEPIPKSLEERARLKAMNFESVREALGERFHMSEKLLSELNRGKRFEAGEEIVVAAVRNALPLPPGQARAIEIDKSERILFVLGDENRPLAAFPISIGGPRDPLPIGRMTVTSEVKNPSFTYDPALLKTARADEVKTELAPGPNNPVGTMWIGLSKPHWGIHGTPVPSRIGHEETNGCIHLTNWDAARVSSLVKAGFVVDVKP